MRAPPIKRIKIMSESKRRCAEILELKKTPRKRQNTKLKLKYVADQNVVHDPNRGNRQVKLKVLTYDRVEKPPRQPKAAEPVVLAIGRKVTPQEWASHVISLAQIASKGFRQPSNKPNKWQSTSLVEQVSIHAGLID